MRAAAITPSEYDLRAAFEVGGLDGRMTFEAAMENESLRVALTHGARAVARARQRREVRQAARAAINYQLPEEDAA